MSRSSVASCVAALGETQIYVEIGPLLAAQWTGIPVVAGNLVQVLLEAAPHRVHFFLGAQRVPTPAVIDSIARRNGTHLQRDLQNGQANAGSLPLIGTRSLILGIYPSVKSSKGLFSIETSIVHDFSTALTPQFHTLENIEHHLENIVADLESNDFTVCTSAATRDDLVDYLGYPEDRLIVAHGGVRWPDRGGGGEAENADCPQPYIYILGTLEPRKNLAVVARLVERHPEVADWYQFVVSGAEPDGPAALPQALRSLVERGRLKLTGYVAEAAKYDLLRHAAFTLYPSHFEGFGLPVLESLSVGTPCIASFSSSIPEVGGEACLYFDPLSAEGLYRAICELRRAGAPPRDRLKATAHRFTWEGMCAAILDEAGRRLRTKPRRC